MLRFMAPEADLSALGTRCLPLGTIGFGNCSRR
jgi:hypothetical protein